MMFFSAKPHTGTALLAGAVCLLVVGALTFIYTRSLHGDARLQLAAAQEVQARAEVRQANAQANRALVVAAERLQQQAGNAGVAVQSWGERHVNLRQQNLLRNDVNQVLAGTARHAGQVMKLDEFELSVMQADEGLFDMPNNARQPVLLTLRGMMYFRLGQ